MRLPGLTRPAAFRAARAARVRTFAELLRRRSPTAVAVYKRGLLAATGQAEAERLCIEAAAYERCIDTGQAAIGRAAFSATARR